jgi:hypothetical protein
VQFQDESLYLWAKVNPNKPNFPVTIRIIGTGDNIDDALSLRYVVTVQESGRNLVWHVFVEE